MSNRKKLSIIIALGPIEEPLIFNTLHSICPFREDGVETIVVHSCRLSPRIHDKRLLEKIDIYIYKDDNGIYDAYNAGVREASSDWVLFFGQGDIFLGWSELSQALTSASSSVGFVCGKYSLSDKPQSLFSATTERFYTLPTSHQAMVTKRSLLIDKPFSLDFVIAADYYHYISLKDAPGSDVLIHSGPISIVKTGGFSESNMGILHAEYKKIIFDSFSFIQYLYFRLALLSTTKSLRRYNRVRLLIKKAASSILLRG